MCGGSHQDLAGGVHATAAFAAHGRDLALCRLPAARRASHRAGILLEASGGQLGLRRREVCKTSACAFSTAEATYAAEECLLAAGGLEGALVPLLVDLASFGVHDAAREASLGLCAVAREALPRANDGEVRLPALQRCQALKQWISEFVNAIGIANVVSIMIDSRHHEPRTMAFLGRNFGAVYRVDSELFTGTRRPTTVCASPCAAMPDGSGATTADVSGGDRATFIIQPLQEQKAFARANGSTWAGLPLAGRTSRDRWL